MSNRPRHQPSSSRSDRRPQNTANWRSQAPPTSAAQAQKRADRFAAPVKAKDSLDDFGFVSKGDDRLKDRKNQERYHNHINAKYLSYCASSGSSDSLQNDFSRLSLTPLTRPPVSHYPTSTPSRSSSFNTHEPHRPTTSSSTSSWTTASSSKNTVFADARNAELTSILLSQRKLREGLIASHRYDAFTLDVFTSHVRTGILAQQPDSYASALLTLLYDLHPKLPLPHDQLVEFASYQILHLACRVEDFRGAYEVRWEFDIRDRRIDQVLRALVGGDWWSWRCARNRVDQCRGRLMDFAEERMRKQALEGIGRAFMRVERIWLEKVMGMEWGELRREFGVGWELEGRDGDEEAQVVVIKRPRVKAG